MEQPEVEIVRSRRKTVSLEITPEGQVRVRAPFRMPEGEIRRLLREKAGWIRAHRERMLSRMQEARQAERLTETELRALARAMAESFPERVERWAQVLGVRYGRITVRAQRTRWGSCSGKGNLNFNCLLMLAPREVQDYVIVHELCHRREMNHSPRFWALVEGVLPDYKVRRAWLKDHGAALMARLPE